MESDKGTANLRQALLNTVETLQNAGVKVWIMREVPKYPWSVPKALAAAVLHRHDPGELGLPLAAYRAQTQEQDPIFDGLGTKYSNVRILDPTEQFSDGTGRCRLSKDGQSLYFDADHVNTSGAMMLGPLFGPIFGDLGKSM